MLAQPVLKDSLIAPTDTVPAPSIFGDHLLEVANPEPQIHLTDYDFLMAGILLFSFILFVWLYVSNRKRLNQIVKGFYLNRYANQLARDEVSFGNRVSVFLSILFVISTSLFIWQVNTYYGFTGSEKRFKDLIFIGFTILIIYTLKLAMIRLSGFIFQTQKAASDYVMTIFLFCNTLGLFMMPVVVCLAFVEQVSPHVFIYTGLGIVGVFLCTRLIRGLIIGINNIR
ncbi:MAG: DUF4271 domain-containing protein, partial [Bacteroidota bacterium]|nr:DUF4271 domain-containing protein [Bacteroidota bacterium]